MKKTWFAVLLTLLVVSLVGITSCTKSASSTSVTQPGTTTQAISTATFDWSVIPVYPGSVRATDLEAARQAGLKITVSHRSDETNDDFISDFSVAVAADYIRIGSLARGENISKYNRLLQIENQLKIL